MPPSVKQYATASRGKSVVVLLPREALFLRSRDDVAVATRHAAESW